MDRFNFSRINGNDKRVVVAARVLYLVEHFLKKLESDLVMSKELSFHHRRLRCGRSLSAALGKRWALV